MTVTHSPSLGFIGLGLMGNPMAKNFLSAGTALSVWNRTSDKTVEAATLGAHVAASPAALAQDADIVFICLINAASVEEVLFGPNGVAEGAKAGSILVDHSTLNPELTKTFAARLLDACGMRWVDAPISGGVSGAENGSLVIFAGGDPHDVETVKAMVGPVCARIEYMGELGFGQFGKLCNQILVGCNRLAVAEMAVLAGKVGFDAQRLPAILKGALGDSQVLQKDGPYMIRRDYQPRGRCQIMIKDMNSILSLAAHHDVDLPLAKLTQEILEIHAGRGYMDADCSSVMEFYDQPKGDT